MKKGATRIIGEYLPIEYRTEKKKRGWDKREFYKRVRKVGDVREIRLGYVSWRNPRPLFRPGTPVYVRQK